MDLLFRGLLPLMPGAEVSPALSLRDDRECAWVAEEFVGDDADEAGSQVHDVLVVVLFPALRAWEAALGAAEAALVGRRMQLQAEGGCFGAALTELAWTLRQPGGALAPLGPVLGRPAPRRWRRTWSWRWRWVGCAAMLSGARSWRWRRRGWGWRATTQRGGASKRRRWRCRMCWIRRSRGQPRRWRRWRALGRRGASSRPFRGGDGPQRSQRRRRGQGPRKAWPVWRIRCRP
jgi:hypothetical protein